MRHAAAQGATAVLVLPADLPFARVEDIEAMLLRPPTADCRPPQEGTGSRVQVPGEQGASLETRPSPLAPSSLAPGPRPLAPSFVICPDEAEDGTNALLLAPPGDFTFRYGPGSFHAHLAEAERRGRAVAVVPAPGLRFDLDTESDWLVYNGYLVEVAEE